MNEKGGHNFMIMKNHFRDVRSTTNKLITHFVQITLHLRYIRPLHIAGRTFTSVLLLLRST